MSATSCPATSSMTTNCGSFKPEPRATRVAAGMPMRVTTAAATIVDHIRLAGGICETRQRPEDYRCDRGPGAGAGLEASDAEECGH